MKGLRLYASTGLVEWRHRLVTALGDEELPRRWYYDVLLDNGVYMLSRRPPADNWLGLVKEAAQRLERRVKPLGLRVVLPGWPRNSDYTLSVPETGYALLNTFCRQVDCLLPVSVDHTLLEWMDASLPEILFFMDEQLHRFLVKTVQYPEVRGYAVHIELLCQPYTPKCMAEVTRTVCGHANRLGQECIILYKTLPKPEHIAYAAEAGATGVGVLPRLEPEELKQLQAKLEEYGVELETEAV